MEDFTPVIQKYALASKVLVIAITRIEGTWCAYCDSVPGWDHDLEASEVLKHGDKLSARIAKSIFPYPPYSELPYSD